jgi:hypothetical protein
MDLLKALNYGTRKIVLLGKHISNASNNRRIAISVNSREK